MANTIETLSIEQANRLVRTNLSTKAFIKLEAWKKCREIKSIFCMEIIPSLPDEKQESLGSVMHTATISITTDYIPYNRRVSESYAKIDFQKEAQFVRIVRFSLSRLKNYLTICSDYNYVNHATYNKTVLLIENTKALLNRYLYFLSR